MSSARVVLYGRAGCHLCVDARAVVADVISRAGFQPIHLTEVNFQAMYEAQRAQAQGGQPAAN